MSTGASKRLPMALYIGFKVGFLNPTRELLIGTLQKCCNLKLFGPGYSDENELNKGIHQYVDRHGPFDLIFADENSTQEFFNWDKRIQSRFVNHACSFDPYKQTLGYDYYNFLKETDSIKIISLLQSDYYNFTNDRMHVLLESGDYFVTWGQEFIIPKESIAADQIPKKFINKDVYLKWNNNYLTFLKNNRERIISCPHFVGQNELFSKPLLKRKYYWSVLGAQYNARVTASEKIDQAGLRRLGRRMHYYNVLADKIGLNVYSHYWSIAFLRWLFQQSLRRVRYSFTCGSILRWPIRKYFEIPSNGCVLVCEKAAGFEDLGFRHEENAIVTEAGDIIDVHRWLTHNPESSQRIADNGRELVASLHSVDSRAKQIGETLIRIIDGKFNGSCWKDGNYVFR